jgi:hypothetical protein|tara:strand:- start:1059 stop:1295 length:237 start_codon:yes stop_codon:yes gene_type:complete
MGFYESDRIRRKQIGRKKIMGKTEDISISVADDLLKLLWKVWKFRKGGYSKEEASELIEDLLGLAFEILEKVVDKDED